VAGAPWANSEQGAVYVFTEPAYGWAGDNRAAKLTAPHGAAGDFFGVSVAIHGNTVVAGAPTQPSAPPLARAERMCSPNLRAAGPMTAGRPRSPP
jgi:hypothetical protein